MSAGVVSIAADDPCLEGHFPGNPLVPGVVVLDLAARALASAAPDAVVCGVAQAKFASPLRPSEPLSIESHVQEDGARALFRCTCGQRLIAEGVFVLQPRA